MAKKTAQRPEKLPPPSLTESRDSAFKKLQARIEKGNHLLVNGQISQDDFATFKREKDAWSSYNEELLLRMFDNEAMAEEYQMLDWVGVVFLDEKTFYEKVDDHNRNVKSKIDKLMSIQERLELIPERISSAMGISKSEKIVDGVDSKKVFIVHGHDEQAKLAVTRFVEKLKLIPIILNEQANASKTIIEKFESASDVRYAIVLITPDDVCLHKDGSKSNRARQNVIFEMGYFVGKIGRENVCALYKESVEIHSDIHGVLYVPLDDAGAWHLRLAKELKCAGMNFDPNDLI